VASRAKTAVQHERRLAAWVAAGLPVHEVALIRVVVLVIRAIGDK
jgi:hypothetical protein